MSEVLRALASTTWLPKQVDPAPEWQTDRISGMLEKLPDATRVQLSNADKAMIQVGFSVDGLVSLEREQTLVLRLFHEGGSVETIKDAVTTVAQHLPTAFRDVDNGTLPTLEKSIEIRHTNDGATVAKGIIVTPHTWRFWRFLREARTREFRLLRWLAVAASVTLMIALSLALWGDQTALWVREVHGYAERICSALLVAVLTTFVNLTFEYRDWRSEKTEVDWLFG